MISTPSWNLAPWMILGKRFSPFSFRHVLAAAATSLNTINLAVFGESAPLFASHKLPLRGYLAAIAVFCNEVKGKSALAMSRDLGISYKAAWVLPHKLREARAEEMRGRVVGGEGKMAEVDGGYFEGYVKPANHCENRRDRRFAKNQNGKRRVVVIVCERNGNSVPAVFKSEAQATSFIRARVAKGTVVNADASGVGRSLAGRLTRFASDLSHGKSPTPSRRRANRWRATITTGSFGPLRSIKARRAN
jgi:hypothetical protein